MCRCGELERDDLFDRLAARAQRLRPNRDFRLDRGREDGVVHRGRVMSPNLAAPVQLLQFIQIPLVRPLFGLKDLFAPVGYDLLAFPNPFANLTFESAFETNNSRQAAITSSDGVVVVGAPAGTDEINRFLAASTAPAIVETPADRKSVV